MRYSLICCLFFFRIEITSTPVHEPSAINRSSIGVAALPRAELVSIVCAWPDGLIPTKKSLSAKWMIAVPALSDIFTSDFQLKNNMAVFKTLVADVHTKSCKTTARLMKLVRPSIRQTLQFFD